MTAQEVARDMYDRLMALSREAFTNANYEAAYHSLVAALYSAYQAQDEQHIVAVEQEAKDQFQRINTYAPAHRLSNQSAHLRGNASVYESLIRQSGTMRLLLHEGRS